MSRENHPEALERTPVGLLAPLGWDARHIDAALSLEGAHVVAADSESPKRGLLIAGLENLIPSDSVAPVFIFPAAAGIEPVARAIEAFRTLAGIEASPLSTAETQNYRFAAATELGPFSGLTLGEDTLRSLPAIERTSQVEPLISSERGGVFVRVVRDGRPIYLSLAPLPDPRYVRLLKREFRPERFLGLLPLLVFIRALLGESAWHFPGRLFASFLVDDPNLRFTRYGFLDLRELLAAARERDFHAALAMIPLDTRKTRRAPARLLRENPERLSLVVHGIDHLKREFDADVSLAAAESALIRGLARMEEHQQFTGIGFARALTFPHGACNPIWMAAMRNVGFHAAFASRAFPWAVEDDLEDALYELQPAEMAFGGFPVLNRFKAEEPKERLLFQAWLGKPLVVYTHHQFFRDGLGALVEIADFLNRTAAPQWADLGSILRANYQIRRVRDEGSVVRIYSNSVVVGPEQTAPVLSLIKPGSGFPPGERCMANGAALPLEEVAAVGLVATDIPAGRRLDIRFEDSRPRVAVSRIAPPFRSRVRRLATEGRDQTSALLARLR